MIRAPGRKSQIERNLVKRSMKLSLDDLKDKHAGALLSSRATKVNPLSYYPTPTQKPTHTGICLHVMGPSCFYCRVFWLTLKTSNWLCHIKVTSLLILHFLTVSSLNYKLHVTCDTLRWETHNNGFLLPTEFEDKSHFLWVVNLRC